MAAEALKATAFPSISIFFIMLISESSSAQCFSISCSIRNRLSTIISLQRSRIRGRQIHRLVPVCINSCIRSISCLCLHLSIRQWRSFNGQCFRLHFLLLLVGLALDLRTGSRTVIHHVADMAHIPVKLEKQGKQCQLCIRIFNQNSLGIQFLSQHIRSETLRNQCKFQTSDLL